MKTLTLPHTQASIEKAQNYIQSALKKHNADGEAIARTLLATEEVLARMTAAPDPALKAPAAAAPAAALKAQSAPAAPDPALKAPAAPAPDPALKAPAAAAPDPALKAQPAAAPADADERELTVGVRNLLGELEVVIRGWGEPFDVSDLAAGLPSGETSSDPDVQEVIRNTMTKLLGGRVVVHCNRGRISVSISVIKSPKRQLYLTLLGLGLGIVAGVLVRGLLPPDFQAAVCRNLFDPASTIFLNAIKLVVTPLVLFSIASSLSEFGDMKALGRVGGKVFLFSLVTSILALGTGLLMSRLFPFGNPMLKAAVTENAASDAYMQSTSALSTNIVDIIVRFVPSEIISPILNGDMLQVIFIAILLGVAATKTGQWSAACRNGLQALNALFSKATGLIISVLPIAIFCSMAKTVINVDVACILSLLSWPIVNVAGFLLQFVLYAMLILIFAKLNPFPFFRKFSNAMLMAVSLCSSTSTIPFAMDTCGKKLGVHHKVYAFSIPVGQALNMNGNAISLIISTFFMARIFGITMTPHLIFSVCVSVFVLCIGTPGIPGTVLVSLAIILPQVGIPAEAISIIMGLYPVAGMLMAGINLTGNAAVTTIVASREGLIDRSMYNE